MAPIFSPPWGIASILSNGKRLMSSTCAGVSTFSFIRSTSVVPPARYRTSAPCWAVFARAAAAIAAVASAGRVNSKVFIALAPARGYALLRTFWIAATILA